MILNEATRNDILSRSKEPTPLERFKRRLTINDVSITRIGILEMAYLNDENLTIFFEINGKYRVSVQLLKFMLILRSYYNANIEEINKNGGISKSKVLRKIVEIVLNKSLDSYDIKIDCTCPDFQYRFAYTATMNGYKFGDPQNVPAIIRNPENLGGSCKHIAKVLSRPSLWKAKVVTGILSVLRRRPELLTGA